MFAALPTGYVLHIYCCHISSMVTEDRMDSDIMIFVSLQTLRMID